VSEAPGHARHYTLEEANAALPRVRELIEALRAASDRLGDREAREALTEASPGNGGGDAGKTVSEGFLAMREAMLELRRDEVVLRDLQRGLVDFPALQDGREIYLCWEEGEDEIGWWHEPEAGFGGRRPLEGG
jgi:hypothetical protein